jgi:[acyl-carrier-protein] S-malonyltransferase
MMPQTAFLFPGQGAQTVGMAGALCLSLPAAKALFDRAATLVGYDLLPSVSMAPPIASTPPTSASRPFSSPAWRHSNS